MSNLAKLKKEIYKLSTTDIWDTAGDEWSMHSEFFNQEPGRCICGHSIKWRYIIINTINNNTCIIGSTCISHFNNIRLNNEIENIIKTRKQKAKAALKEQRRLQLIVNAEEERKRREARAREIARDMISLGDRDCYKITFKKSSENDNQYFITPMAEIDEIFLAIAIIAEGSKKDLVGYRQCIPRTKYTLKVKRNNMLDKLFNNPNYHEYTMKIYVSAKPWIWKDNNLYGFSLYLK